MSNRMTTEHTSLTVPASPSPDMSIRLTIASTEMTCADTCSKVLGVAIVLLVII